MEILIIILITVLNGVLAMGETAFVSARKARLQQLADDGDSRARITLEMMDDPNRFLSTTQIGITLIGILAGAFGGATIAETIAAQLNTIPALAPYSKTIALALVVLFTTYLSLVIGELVPKRLALQNPERIATAIVPWMRILERITAPVVRFLGASTEIVLRLLGVRRMSRQ
jgi:putative hemolysin